MCRKQISKDSGRTTQNALGLYEELEKQYNLGIDRLGILKQISKQLKKRSILRRWKDLRSREKVTN